MHFTKTTSLLIVTAFLLAGIVTASNYGTAYAYSTDQIANFHATTLSYYQTLNITAIVPPAKFGEIGIKSTPDNAITGQEIQIQITVNYPLIKDGGETVGAQQTPNHQHFSYVEATRISDLMINKSALVYQQDNFANGTILRNLVDVSETGARRGAGIKYSGLIMSAEQAAVCFCAINGFTYENVTESSTIVTFGEDGQFPIVTAMELSAPVPVDYDVSDGIVDPYNTTPPMYMGMSTESASPTPENAVHMPLQFTPTYDIPADLQANTTGMQTEVIGLDDLIIAVLLTAAFFVTMIMLEVTGLWDWMGLKQRYFDDGYRAGWADGVRAQANSDNATIWEAFDNGTITLQQALYLSAEIYGNMNYNLENCPTPPKVEGGGFDIWALVWAIIEFLMPVIIVVVVAFIAWALICHLLRSSKSKLSEALSDKPESSGGRRIYIDASKIYTQAMGGLLAVV